MRATIFAVAALAALAACSDPAPPATAAGASDSAAAAAPAAPEPAAAAAAPDALTNRMWVRTDGGDLPGRMILFLDNGRMLMDSCWETYRINEWRRDGADKVVWSEDRMEIAADIVSLSASALTLRLNLVGGPEEQRYKPAAAPFVCPDMPR